MAEVKGLTIEIGADTTKASQSISQVNKDIKSTEKELKEVDRLLKLDPNNVELLNQKQILLNKSISTSNIKLDQLTKKESELKDAGVDDNVKQYRELQREIVKTNNSIEQNSKSLKNNDGQKKKSTKSNKKYMKGMTALKVALLAIGAVVVSVGKKLVEWAVEGAKSASLSTEEYSKFADTLYALEESSTKAKNALGSLLLPALEKLSEVGVEALDKIIEAVETKDTSELFDYLKNEINNLISMLSESGPDFVYDIADNILKTIPEILPGLVQAVLDLIPPLFDAIIENLPAIITTVFDVLYTLMDNSMNHTSYALSRIFSKYGANIGIALVNGIIDGLNKLANFTIPELKLFGKQLWDDTVVNLFNIPKIPMLAKGGIVKEGTAIVGEAGAELLTVANGQATVQPLTNNTTNNNYYGGGEQISINFTGSLSQLARILQPEIKIEQDRVGESLLS